MWTPFSSRALRYAGRVATRVLPSPVTISEMLPRCSTAPPTICPPTCRCSFNGRARSRREAHAHVLEASRATPVGQPFAKLRRQPLQLGVAEGQHFFFQLVDLVQQGAGDDGVFFAVAGTQIPQGADVALVAGAEQPGHEADDAFGKAVKSVAQSFK